MKFFTAFQSRGEFFSKSRDGSSLAGSYSSFISQQLSAYSGLRGFGHIGALIIEPGKKFSTFMSLIITALSGQVPF